MAVIIECPNKIETHENTQNVNLFLAGGISNVPDWHSYVIRKLKDIKNLTIYNPRRQFFDTENKSLTEEQIIWEYEQLKNADIISFWFAKETLNPITLYELGKWANSTQKKIVIGIENGYARKDDVIIQTKLARSDIKHFSTNLDDLCTEIVAKVTKIS